MVAGAFVLLPRELAMTVLVLCICAAYGRSRHSGGTGIAPGGVRVEKKKIHVQEDGMTKPRERSIMGTIHIDRKRER